ncbi:MAG: hypothetical protein NZZ41_00015 [Candidatus Dojkabacteria bacterium]|nr:hypothetical protein [Candidatus Dojkabacteria bacterium]
MKYLTNENILKEIDESKKSFCFFKEKRFENYDFIIEDKKNLNFKYLNTLLEKKKSENPERDYIVVRVMDDSHIPEEYKDYTKRVRKKYSKNYDLLEEMEIQKRNSKKENIFVDFYDQNMKLNFKPFKHYLYKENYLEEVGRSHWKGDLENGYFCQTHGKITDNLGKMFMKLVEKYSQRGNWRSYTYLEEMKGFALTQLCLIALKFDENKSSNPFAYYTSAITNAFTRVLHLEKRNQSIKDNILIDSGHNPSFGRQIDEEEKDRLHKENGELFFE